jgi:hypothetical protein
LFMDSKEPDKKDCEELSGLVNIKPLSRHPAGHLISEENFYETIGKCKKQLRDQSDTES